MPRCAVGYRLVYYVVYVDETRRSLRALHMLRNVRSFNLPYSTTHNTDIVSVVHHIVCMYYVCMYGHFFIAPWFYQVNVIDILMWLCVYAVGCCIGTLLWRLHCMRCCWLFCWACSKQRTLSRIILRATQNTVRRTRIFLKLKFIVNSR